MTIFFLILALLCSGFIFWQKIRQEHFDDYDVFDYFLLSLFFAWILARLAYIIFNWSTFGFNFLNYLDIVSYPGISYSFLLVFWGLIFSRYLKNKTDSVFQVLDFWASSVTGGAIFLHLAWFLTGVHIGRETTLPWGVKFAGSFSTYSPSQLVAALLYTLLLFFLLRLEFNYRRYNWYKGNRGSAQPGFILAVFLAGIGVIHLLLSLIKSSEVFIHGVALDPVLSLLGITSGLVILIIRSGRFSKTNNNDKKVQEFNL